MQGAAMDHPAGLLAQELPTIVNTHLQKGMRYCFQVQEEEEEEEEEDEGRQSLFSPCFHEKS